MNFILNKLSGFAAKTRTFTIFTLGMAIIIASVGISLILVPTKLLAVIVVAFGTFIGSIILASSMTKIISQKLEDEREEKEKEIRTRVTMENEIAQSKLLEKERDNLQNELTLLKNMKLDVNSISKIMDLGVAKAEMTFRDFKKIILSQESSKIARDESKEYIGLLECKYTSKLGVDLLKLKFLENEDGYIEVSGLKTETLGILDRDKTWLLREIRTSKTNSTWIKDSYEIEKEDGELIKHSDKQSNDIDKMIENGINLKHFDEYITKLAKDFLLLLLSPLQKEVRFVETENENAKELVHFLTQNNNMIEEKIRILENQSNTKLAKLEYNGLRI